MSPGKPDSKLTISEILMLTRRRMGFSQAELGKRAGLTRNTIAAIEHGDTTVKISSLIAVCEVMGYEIGIRLVEKEGDK